MVTTAGDLTRTEMKREIARLCAPDNTTNWFILLGEYVAFATAVGICLGSYHAIVGNGGSIWWMVPIYFATICFVGVWTQNRLGCLLHEASHYLLFKNRRLNDIAANLLVAFPLFGAIGHYRLGHWAHHRNVNDPETDPDLKRLLKHHPREFPIGKWRFLWEYILLQLSPHKAFSYLKGRAEYVTFRAASEPVKGHDPLGKTLFATLRIGYYATLVVVLTLGGWWPHFFLFWLVPMATFYPAILFLREIAHHGNYPDNGDYTNSRVYEGKWLERAIFFAYGERNHVLHHMFPTVPWHKVLKAHETMMRYPPYRENVVICDGFFLKGDRTSVHPTVLDVLAKPSRTYLRDKQEVATSIRHETAEQVGAIDPQAAAWHGGES